MDIFQTKHARKATATDTSRRVAMCAQTAEHFVVYHINEQTGGFYDHAYFTREECGGYMPAFGQAREEYVKRCVEAGLDPAQTMPSPPKGTEPKISTRRDSRCQDCGLIVGEKALDHIQGLTKRISPGEPVPSGQCPECGALCTPIRPSAWWIGRPYFEEETDGTDDTN